MQKYYMSETIWERLFGILRTIKTIYTKNKVKTQQFLEGVFFIMRTGAQWRELPSYYGHWRTVHKRFEAWSRKEIWCRLLECFASDSDMESVMLDTTTIRAHACASGYQKGQQARECLGRSRGGFSTKIHALVDALGNPLKFILTPGQRHDITQAPYLLEGIEKANVIADKSFDANKFINQVENQNCQVVIPARANRKQKRDIDRHLYKERHLIECFFGKIKNFRRVFSRFEKKASSYMGFLCFAATLIWLR